MAAAKQPEIIGGAMRLIIIEAETILIKSPEIDWPRQQIEAAGMEGNRTCPVEE